MLAHRASPQGESRDQERNQPCCLSSSASDPVGSSAFRTHERRTWRTNVNKVSSKVTLHWSVARRLPCLKTCVSGFGLATATESTKLGELVLQSQRHRDQARNVEDLRGEASWNAAGGGIRAPDHARRLVPHVERRNADCGPSGRIPSASSPAGHRLETARLAGWIFTRARLLLGRSPIVVRQGPHSRDRPWNEGSSAIVRQQTPMCS